MASFSYHCKTLQSEEGVSFSSDLASGTLATLNETDITLNLSGNGSTISDANEESADAKFVFLDECSTPQKLDSR